MEVKHFDIHIAYLNGGLSHEVFMKQPKGFSTNDNDMACKLVKNLYGLKQGANKWNKKFDTVMKNNEYTQSQNDLCLYRKRTFKQYMYISIHVDDIVVASTDMNLINNSESLMKIEFIIKNLGTLKFFLGIHFDRDDDSLFYMNQERYITNKLREFNLTDAKDSNTPINVGYLN